MVATPDFTTLASPPLPRLARGGARSHARWVTPAVVGGVDASALVVAVRLVGPFSELTLLYVLLAIVTLGASGAYRTRMTLSALDAAPWLCTRLAAPLLLLAPAAWMGANVAALLKVALVSVPTLVIARGCSYAVLRHLRRAGHLVEPAVILGAGEIGVELAHAFGAFPELGVTTVGFLDHVLDDDLPAPLLGDVDSLPTLLADKDVSRVIVAFGPARESELVSVLRTAVQYEVDVHVVPRFFDCGVTPEGPDTDDVQGIPLYRVRRAALRAPAWFVKRILDVAVSGVVLVATAPLFAVLAVAVKLSSPGPVFFRQERIGQDSHTIDVPKFRTLRVNHDSDTHWSADQDPRVTGIGRLLRGDVAGRAPAVLERLHRPDVAGRPPAGTGVLRHSLRAQHPGLQRPPPAPGRPHRLGAGPRPAWRHLDRGAGPLRQPVHRALVAVARHRHLGADRRRGAPQRPRRDPLRPPPNFVGVSPGC